MHCFWCDNEADLTDDHIIPRSLGGTKEFTVESCRDCQRELSKAEDETARKSILAIPALVSPVRPCHPKRPTSGHLRPSYLMVKHPFGGYGESLLSAGERMTSLPYFEIKVVPGEEPQASVRGATAAEAQLLLDTFRLALQNKPGPNGLICEFTVNMHLDPAIAADPDFWPRVVMLPGPRLMVRTRDPEELMRFVNVFMQVATSNYQVNPAAWGEHVVITGGTPHSLGLQYDPQCVRRVAAKIAYGLFRTAINRSLNGAEDLALRRYILGIDISVNEPVSITSELLKTFTTSNEPRYVVFSPLHDRGAAMVSLYGLNFRVEMGSAAVLSEPAAVVCEIDGSGMRICSTEETRDILNRMGTPAFSQPWREVTGARTGAHDGK